MAPMERKQHSRLLSAALLAFAAVQCISWSSTAAPARAEVPAPEPEEAGFMSKVIGAAAQGATAAFVAAILSATTEPIVNRLLVERKTFGQAIAETDITKIARFFLTTFPTNMLKFPVFEVINMMLSFTSMSGGLRGMVNGFLFCTIMLPAMVFGLTVFFACIISSPGNEWRGYTLQRPDKKLPFNEYFKPINYMRSTGVGATIMGIALSTGMLITPYVEKLVGALSSMF